MYSIHSWNDSNWTSVFAWIHCCYIFGSFDWAVSEINLGLESLFGQLAGKSHFTGFRSCVMIWILVFHYFIERRSVVPNRVFLSSFTPNYIWVRIQSAQGSFWQKLFVSIVSSLYLIFQGNFFQNVGSISIFAIFGTVINALVVGSGVFILGLVMVNLVS